jgi:hypothetical protein
MAETRFEGSSPVARYWLAQCEGFAVRGGAEGVVEELIRDREPPFVTTRLVVRVSRGRRAVVPADAVASVDPAERVVFVEQRRRRRDASSPRMPRARQTVSRAASGTTATSRRLVHTCFEATTRMTPVLVRTGQTAAETTTAAVGATRRHAPVLAAYVRRKAAPVARVLGRSFMLLAAEAVGTARLLVSPRRSRRQLTDGSSGIRETSS